MTDYTGTLWGRILCGLGRGHRWRLLRIQYSPYRIACESCGEHAY